MFLLYGAERTLHGAPWFFGLWSAAAPWLFGLWSAGFRSQNFREKSSSGSCQEKVPIRQIPVSGAQKHNFQPPTRPGGALTASIKFRNFDRNLRSEPWPENFEKKTFFGFEKKYHQPIELCERSSKTPFST